MLLAFKQDELSAQILVYANEIDITDRTGNYVKKVFKTLHQAASKMAFQINE